MKRLLLIDDTACKKDLDRFLEKHFRSVIVNQEADEETKGLEDLLAAKKNRSQEKIIAINASNCVSILRVKDIIHCKSFRNYTQLHLNNGTEITVSKTLKQFERLLSAYQFIRIHQSYLVNLNYVVKYNKSHGGCIVLLNGNELPVAIRKKEHLFRELSIV